MDSSLYSQMYGWSLLRNQFKHPTPPIAGSAKDLGYVDILCSLAFVLTSQARPRVSAAGVQARAGSFKIFLATNEEFQTTETDNVEVLAREILRETNTQNLLCKIIAICEARIYQYGQEVVENFAYLRKEHTSNLKHPEMQLKKLLDDLESVKGRSGNALNPILLEADTLSKKLKTIMRRRPLRPLENLGRYYGAAKTLCEAAQRLPALGIEIELEHLRGSGRQFVEVDSDITYALIPEISSNLSSHDLDIIFGQILARYPCACRGSAPNQKIKIAVVQHPSLTLCLHFVNRPFQGKIYLGASDFACCSLCEDWIREAESISGLNIYKYCCIGEWPDDWFMPEGTPIALRKAMEASRRLMMRSSDIAGLFTRYNDSCSSGYKEGA